MNFLATAVPSGSYVQDFAFAFLSVLFEGLPFIFIGTLISGFIDVYLPSKSVEKYLPKNKYLSLLVCGLMGLIVPVCECTVVPVIRRLIAKGLPLGSAFTYMLAAPIVNPITFMSTYTAFAGEPLEMALSRMVLGYLVALSVGVILLFVPIERVLKPALVKRLHFSGVGCSDSHTKEKVSEESCCSGHQHSCADSVHGHEHSHSCGHDSEHHHHDGAAVGAWEKFVAASRTAVRDFMDVAMYFVIGITLMTLFKSAANTNALLNYLSDSEKLLEGTVFMIGLSFILSLCSTSDAFVVATSFERLSIVPKMAFLVFGPMMDIKLMLLYQTMMRWKTVLVLTLLLFVLIIAFCMGWGIAYPTLISLFDEMGGAL
jgi:uncharacterized membrane protein YraQ (UPF0718 family)